MSSTHLWHIFMLCPIRKKEIFLIKIHMLSFNNFIQSDIPYSNKTFVDFNNMLPGHNFLLHFNSSDGLEDERVQSSR